MLGVGHRQTLLALQTASKVILTDLQSIQIYHAVMCTFYLLKYDTSQYISLLPGQSWQLDEFKDHCYSFSSKSQNRKLI